MKRKHYSKREKEKFSKSKYLQLIWKGDQHPTNFKIHIMQKNKDNAYTSVYSQQINGDEKFNSKFEYRNFDHIYKEFVNLGGDYGIWLIESITEAEVFEMML